MCTYISSMIAAHAIPPTLLGNWHSAVLLGIWTEGLAAWLEHEYALYRTRCNGHCVAKGIEEWLQGYGYHVPGLEHLEAVTKMACFRSLAATDVGEGP